MLPNTRYLGLDGLRGIAALVVVVHHGFLTSPILAKAYSTGDIPDGWPRILAYSPLHTAWAGTEAVVIFFVLSGIVLTLPRRKAHPEKWLTYYAKRTVRLYAPTMAAVVFSVLVVGVVGRRHHPDNWWMDSHAMPSISQTLGDLALIGGSGDVNKALWSLTAEVWFSALLPFYVFLGLLTWRLGFRLGFPTGFIVVASTVALGLLERSPALTFMPVFGIGVLIAMHLDKLAPWSERVLSKPFCLFFTVAFSLVALTLKWNLLGLGVDRTIAKTAGAVGVLLASLVLVLIAMYSQPAAAIFEGRAIRWLGTRSFSLYLTHEPIVVSVGTVLPDRQNPALVTSIGLCLALLVAELFYRLVEEPSLQLSRRVGLRVAGRQQGGRPKEKPLM